MIPEKIESLQPALLWERDFLEGKITLYDALGYFMYQDAPLPHWLVEAIEQGFADRIRGIRDLDQVFGLTPKPGKQIDKIARKLEYAPLVYSNVVQRSENGEPIDAELFEKIAIEMKPRFLKVWKNKKPPGARTIQEWYLEELEKREPGLKKIRDKTKYKTT